MPRALLIILGFTLILVGCVTPEEDRARVSIDNGLRFYQQGNFAAAQQNFQAALQFRPGDADLVYNIGQCYEHQNDSPRAEQTYLGCLRQSPNHVAAHNALAALLIREGRKPEATRFVQDWLAHQPRLAAAYALDGWLWHQSGDLPRAQARLQQALELDPHDVTALTELGLVYEDLNRPERAVVLYERVLALDARQPQVENRLHVLLAKGAGRPQPE
jgi:tetratricopeptide (TPR) repeat protein